MADKENTKGRQFVDVQGNIVPEGDESAAYMVAGEDGVVDRKLVAGLKRSAQAQGYVQPVEAPQPVELTAEEQAEATTQAEAQGKAVAAPPQNKAYNAAKADTK